MCNREIAKKMAMNNTTKTKVDQDEDSFTHVPETWAIASKSQCETREMEGGNELIEKGGVYDKEAEQSAIRDDGRQVGQVDPNDVITTSTKEVTSLEVVINCNTRVNHKSGQSAKHETCLQDLEVGMHLNVQHGVVNVIVQINTQGGEKFTKQKCMMGESALSKETIRTKVEHS